MLNIIETISCELSLKILQLQNTLELRKNGSTIPFIARYRKEMTGELNENQIRDIFEKYDYYSELEERKIVILKSIEEQGKLTDELKTKIETTLKKNELEDLYLPYKPKKRTRAIIATEKGLAPLALEIKVLNYNNTANVDLLILAEKFISTEKGVETAKEALKGASDIIAEEIAETAEYRAVIRDFLFYSGKFTSKIKPDFPEDTTNYESYRNFEIPVKDITPHVMLALRRGEAEEILSLDLVFDEAHILKFIENKILVSENSQIIDFFKNVIKDAFNRLMKISLITEIRLDRKKFADEESIKVFGTNLRQILLAPPAGMEATLGIDPGFRTGCKVSVVDNTGKFLEYHTIFPFHSDYQVKQATEIVSNLLSKYSIKLIAIGNGTAGRETEVFIDSIIENLDDKPTKVVVSEAGASVYSASEVANEEFPDLDLTIRGAISIARRLQDPLAELVKIDAKSIGVGQYQHDVDQKLLKNKLEDIVSSCVNFVGVDLNTASKELLTYISGINPNTAKNIIEWRNNNGAFQSRKDLLKVPSFGPKAFEQSAGFLRIRNGKNLLDNTAVHPESYHIINKFSEDLKTDLTIIINTPDILKQLNLKNYITDTIGEPTLKDIISELEKPGRDPRDKFISAKFDSKIKTLQDLKLGMILEGVITNITNFGAFVDVGVHQDGLVHVSEIANTFVKDPHKFISVGQIVKVKVLDIKESLSRFSLSIKQVV